MGEEETQETLAEAELEDIPEDVEEGILTPADIAGLMDAFPRELLRIPEWRKSVWVWAYTLESERIRWDAMQAGKDVVTKINRGMIARVVEAVRVDGEPAEGGGPPARLFDREKHWQWLTNQPMAVLQRICTKSEELNQERAATEEQIRGFFALTGSAVACLKHIGSVCGACTECPMNSTARCPSVLSMSLWLPTV